jgi:uncharacterized protein with PIN domain
MKPLSPTEISEILGAVQGSQDNTRAMLARWLRVQGYPMAAPKNHILERLTALREQEAEMFRVILHGDKEAQRQREYAREYHQRQRQQRAAGAEP